MNARFLKEKSSRSTGREDAPMTVGFCGRLDPEKGLENLFSGAELYRTGFPAGRIRLLLIGDGPCGRALSERYRHLDVIITGFVDNVIPYLDRLDAFVLASTTETTSLSSLEAYARGLPIFSTRVGFLGQHPENYRHVYNFETPAELAALIREVLEIRKLPIPAVPAAMDASFITFSSLYEMVSSHEENGFMPARPPPIGRNADSGNPRPFPATT